MSTCAASATQLVAPSGSPSEMIVDVLVIIEGYDLPGLGFCAADSQPYSNVHVGVQIRQQPGDLVRGDSASARWLIDVDLVESPDGSRDFRGPAVHGKRGERFVYLTWGDVTADCGFVMFRRAKLMLDRIDPQLVQAAHARSVPLLGRVRLSDDLGMPRCARVDPPAVLWSIGQA